VWTGEDVYPYFLYILFIIFCYIGTTIVHFLFKNDLKSIM